MTHRDERAALLALLRESKESWGRVASRVAFEGTASGLLDGPDDDVLFEVPSDGAAIDAAAAEVAEWEARGLRLTTVLDYDYPRRLLDIRETPPFLFYEGELRAEDEGMSVVGTRKPSEWALWFAKEAAEFLEDQGLTVISGLAAGTDTAAHRAALDAGGRTVAFIGTGITQQYPSQNAELQAEIGKRGLVLSQFFPDAPPTKKTFPMRNASMSGYGLATIVIEASENSGTRNQARLAGEHGRPVILTERVATSTTWGGKLRGAPGVYVVGDLQELAEAVAAIREAPRRVDDALAALAAR
ncbi:MAG: DNA-processing protein DprA [Pseudonocardiaceae bacterium]